MGHSSTPNTTILNFVSNWLVEIPLGVVFSCAGGRIELSLEAERLILDWTSADSVWLRQPRNILNYVFAYMRGARKVANNTQT